MPTQFKINREITDELLDHIRTHPRVVSAVRTNPTTITVTLDGNYTREQIENTAIRFIRDRQMEIMERDNPPPKPEFEI